jgi:hypothetical protein
MTLRTSLLFLGFGLFAFGCKSTPAVDSADIATHGMAMDVEAIADDHQTVLRVKLWVGDADKQGTLVTLSTDDSLMLTSPTSQVLGSVDTQGQGVVYGATLGALDAAKISIDLKRAKAASALGNVVMLPKAFTLKDQNGKTFKRAELFTLDWDRADGTHTMSVDLKGDCIQHFNKALSGDPGTFTLNAGDIKPLSDTDTDKAKSCSVNVVVTRELDNGQFSAEFGHVSVGYARQIRGYTITSAP